MMKLLVNQTLYAQGLHATQVLGTVFDGITRHTAEGYDFQRRAAESGFREAVRERDEPFGDAGLLDVQGLVGHRRVGESTSEVDAPVHRRVEWSHPADVAQLARASPCHGEGRGFESLHPLHVVSRDIGDRCLGSW